MYATIWLFYSTKNREGQGVIMDMFQTGVSPESACCNSLNRELKRSKIADCVLEQPKKNPPEAGFFETKTSAIST